MALVGDIERTGWSHNGSSESKLLNDSAFDDSISMITPAKAQPHGHMVMSAQVDGAIYGSPMQSRSSGKFETSSESGMSIANASPSVVLRERLNFAQCAQREAEAKADVESRKTDVARLQLVLASARRSSGSTLSRSRSLH